MKTFGQMVIGPPGSGKTTYCLEMAGLLTEIGRKVAIINLDPANDNAKYEAFADISELITVRDAMRYLKIGPNGGLVYSMKYLDENLYWLTDYIDKLDEHYILFDCPGQVELYTHDESVKRVACKLRDMNIHLCCVHLVDSHYCSDAGKFISTVLLSLSTMMQMEMPHVNVLSKIDILAECSRNMLFGLDFYTDVLDLKYLLDSLQSDPFTSKYKKLNEELVSIVEDYSLVTFIPMDVKNRKHLLSIKNAVDKANGYIFGSGEERSVRKLLACAMAAGEDSKENMGWEGGGILPKDNIHFL